MDIRLTAGGQLLLAEHGSPGDERAPASEAAAQALRKAGERGTPALLLHLAALPDRAGLSPALVFWRGFAERYVTELCRTPEPAEDLSQPLPPPTDELSAMVNAAPPMAGGEYLRIETMEEQWRGLDHETRGHIAAQSGGFSEWLRRTLQRWHRVGRVCFHLAENKRDADYPFAFLATYAPKLLDGGRVQYQPLGRALEEHAEARNQRLLKRLLEPVQRAAEQCLWVRELVDSGQIFHPLAWTPAEAHRLLRDLPQLESCGLLVRVPNWWTRHPTRVQVGISIGNKPIATLGADAMLDFRVTTTLEGEPLTPEEWRDIMAGADGLAFIKGRWVEVDRERLKETLQHWKKVQKAAGSDGISFLQGMRLLAGASLDGDALSPPTEDAEVAWASVHAGDGLGRLLQQIRAPDCADVALPPPQLQATLRPYQEVGVKWLWLLSRLGLGACLADDMGLGKTIQVLTLLLMLKQQPRSGTPRGPALLVLPASLLANWKSEIDRFAPSLRCLFAHPSLTPPAELAAAARQPERALEGIDLVLTTYATLTRLEWLASQRWSVVVADEAQAIKNPAARQTRAVKQLKAGCRIALTGTPVENRLTDLWSIFDFLCPGLLGSVKTFAGFVRQLETRSDGQYGPLRRLVGPYILRRLKTDRTIITDLPDKVEQTAYCQLSKRQAVLYEESVRELSKALSEQEQGIGRRGLILAFILRLKQICNHPDQWLGTGAFAPNESGKFSRIRALVEEVCARQEKALVFSQFKELTGPLAEFLATQFGRPGLVLHGGTPVGRRKAMVDSFQREDGPPFMVLSLKAGGTGLNLTAASHVVHFDRWWNPAVENQATDRAFRIGQTRNVMVHKFVCQGTIEERIDALIRGKAALAGEILAEGVPKLVTEMSDAELLNLVRLDIHRATEE